MENTMPRKRVVGKEYIEIRFGPEWRFISATRTFIQNFLAISLLDEEKANKMAMAASELLENAVKYSSDDETTMIVEVDSTTKKVVISVGNRADQKDLQELQTIFKDVSEGDPLQMYLERMKQAATGKTGHSRLGLARIRYETGAEMGLSVEDGNLIKITISL